MIRLANEQVKKEEKEKKRQAMLAAKEAREDGDESDEMDDSVSDGKSMGSAEKKSQGTTKKSKTASQ